jgi:hypothetical protein
MIASGYNEDILPYGWLALIAGLGDFKVDIPEPAPPPQYDKNRIQRATQITIDEVKNSLRDYWTFS